MTSFFGDDSVGAALAKSSLAQEINAPHAMKSIELYTLRYTKDYLSV
jgi:hypothetical protein